MAEKMSIYEFSRLLYVHTCTIGVLVLLLHGLLTF